MVNARSGWKLVTFDLDFDLETYFRIFPAWAILLNGFTLQLHFWYGDTSSEYLGHGLFSRSWVQDRVTAAQKRATQNLLVGNCWVLIGISVTITLEVICSF